MDPYELAERGVPELTDWVRGLTVGSITVLDVEYNAGPDASDLPALFVDLILTDPVDGPGWPGDDVWELQCRVVGQVPGAPARQPVRTPALPALAPCGDGRGGGGLAVAIAPLEPRRLLDHALRVARAPDRGPVPPEWLRRSVSASYYAVFHRLAIAMADQVAPGSPAVERYRLCRSLDHGRVADVCRWLTGGGGKEHVRPVVDRLRDNLALAELAEALLLLQIARHGADYDHLADVSERETLSHARTAARALDLLDALAPTADGQEFLALVALHTALR